MSKVNDWFTQQVNGEHVVVYPAFKTEQEACAFAVQQEKLEEQFETQKKSIVAMLKDLSLSIYCLGIARKLLTGIAHPLLAQQMLDACDPRKVKLQ